MKNNIISILITLIFFNFIFSSSNYLVELCNKETVLIISHSENADDVAQKLSDDFCINKFLFKMVMRLTGNDTNIKPGKYNLSAVNNMYDLVDVITSNEVVVMNDGVVVKNDIIEVTLLEGWNLKQIVDYLANNKELNLDKERLMELCFDLEFIKSLNLNHQSLEGFLYPNTYYLLQEYNEDEVLKIFVDEYKDVFRKQISQIENNTKLSSYEIIILASIIQAEGMYIDEMTLISSVYHNRLNKNMLLQADPTILYYMQEDDLRLFKEGKGSVFKRYKKMDNKYNTYKYKGLPIGPICSPSANAIKAALLPEKSSYLYFFGNETGRHSFSLTYKEHLNKINEYRKSK